MKACYKHTFGYANALVALAQESGAVSKFNEDLKAVVEVWGKTPEFKEMLTNPRIPKAIRVKTIGQISEKLMLDVYFGNFLKLLVEKEKFVFFSEIASKVLKAFEELLGEVTVKTYSPFELPQDIKDEMTKQLEKTLGLKVNLDSKIDESLVGGVKLHIGNKIYDGSVCHELGSMSQTLEKKGTTYGN